MTVSFSFTHNISAGTPMIAAEVQDNFSQLLDWIEDYYQQQIETTAEIAAAIADLGTNVVNVVAENSAVLSASTFQGNGGTSTNNAITGLTASWTADLTHSYELSVYNLGMTLSGAATGRRVDALINYRINGAGSYFNIAQTSFEVISTARPLVWAPGGASALIRGQSGAVTAQIFTNVDLVPNVLPLPTYTYIAGTARVVVRDLGVTPNQVA